MPAEVSAWHYWNHPSQVQTVPRCLIALMTKCTESMPPTRQGTRHPTCKQLCSSPQLTCEEGRGAGAWGDGLTCLESYIKELQFSVRKPDAKVWSEFMHFVYNLCRLFYSPPKLPPKPCVSSLRRFDLIPDPSFFFSITLTSI